MKERKNQWFGIVKMNAGIRTGVFSFGGRRESRGSSGALSETTMACEFEVIMHRYQFSKG
jgi:hypothetical protein